MNPRCQKHDRRSFFYCDMQDCSNRLCDQCMKHSENNVHFLPSALCYYCYDCILSESNKLMNIDFKSVPTTNNKNIVTTSGNKGLLHPSVDLNTVKNSYS